MRPRGMVLLVVLWVALATGAAAVAAAGKPSFPAPPPAGRVTNDAAGLITKEHVAEIDRLAGALLAQKGYPVRIVTIRSLEAISLSSVVPGLMRPATIATPSLRAMLPCNRSLERFIGLRGCGFARGMVDEGGLLFARIMNLGQGRRKALRSCARGLQFPADDDRGTG